MSDAEVEALVAAFESSTITPSQFPHTAHLAVALSYLAEMPLAEATARMRASLLRFTEYHGVKVYHETLTTFWMRLLAHVVSNDYGGLPLWQRINVIVDRWGTAAPIKAHYSDELIRSAAARREWVAPDRSPIPF